MKRSPILLIIVILLGVLLLLSIALNTKQYFEKEARQERTGKLIEAGGTNTVEKTYVRDSITHTVFNEKIISDDRGERQLAIGKTYADSIEQALKMAIQKIDVVTKINAQLYTQLALKETTTPQGKKALSHNDKTINLNYFPETDSVDLAVNIGLNEARYSKKKWLLGNKQNYIDVFPDDERIKIKGLKSFTIKERSQKRFGIGISTGYGFSISDQVVRASPYIGFGINYNLLEF